MTTKILRESVPLSKAWREQGRSDSLINQYTGLSFL